MERVELDELKKRKRMQFVRLIEVSDLSRQIAESADRNDQVSMNMLLSMRQEPLRQLTEIETGLEQYLLSLPEDSAIRGKALLRGAPPETPEEEPLCAQVAQYRRLLENVIALDRQLSLRIGGERSFYRTFR